MQARMQEWAKEKKKGRKKQRTRGHMKKERAFEGKK